MRDYKVIFPDDANAAFQDEVHRGMIISLDMGAAMIMKTDALIQRLAA